MGARASLRNPVGWFYGLAALFWESPRGIPRFPAASGALARRFVGSLRIGHPRRGLPARRRAPARHGGFASGDSFVSSSSPGGRASRMIGKASTSRSSRRRPPTSGAPRRRSRSRPIRTPPLRSPRVSSRGARIRRSLSLGMGARPAAAGFPRRLMACRGGVAAPGKLAPNRAVVSLVLPRSAPPAGSVAVRAEVACDEGAAAPRSIAITTKSGSQSSRVTAPLREVAPGRLFAEAAIATPPTPTSKSRRGSTPATHSPRTTRRAARCGAGVWRASGSSAEPPPFCWDCARYQRSRSSSSAPMPTFQATSTRSSWPIEPAPTWAPPSARSRIGSARVGASSTWGAARLRARRNRRDRARRRPSRCSPATRASPPTRS